MNRTFRFTYPHAKNFLQTVLFQSDAKVNGLIYDLAVIPYLEDDTVHPDYQINRIQWAVLPLLGGLIYLVCNDGNGRCREFNFINLTHLFLYIGNAHPFGV